MTAHPPTALARLRAHVAARRPRGACRVLLVTGWYRHMPIGDSVIATQHVPFLGQLADDVRITVWTGSPALWTWLCPGVRPIEPPPRIVASSFDVAIFETTLAPPRLADALAARGLAVVSWQAGLEFAEIRLGARDVWRVRLPRLLNRTCRIPEVYGRLGFRAATLPGRRAPAAPPIVYLNPYASRAEKAMSPAFLTLLLAALHRELGDRARVVAPAPPATRDRVDREAFGRLAAVVAAARGVSVRPRGSLDRYCKDVAASALVVGGDTSSHHLAQAIGRPSITCYPATVGRHFHFFWGPVRTDALHVDVPPDAKRGAQRRLAALVARLSTRCIGLTPKTPSRVSPVGPDVVQAAARFVAGCDAYLRNEMRDRRAIAAALAAVRRALPADWADHVTGELARIYDDLPALRRRPAVERRMARARLRHLNAPRLARALVGP